jgi:hypothetical protein
MRRCLRALSEQRIADHSPRRVLDQVPSRRVT